MRVDLSEAMRYLGAPGTDEMLLAQMARVEEEAREAARPKSVWRAFALEHTPQGEWLPDAGVLLPGALAKRVLENSERAALLVCTLGAPFDGMLRAWQYRDMARAVMLDAYGSACVEAAVDEVESEIASAQPGWYLTDRFSPGYGDVPLALQPSLLSATDAARRVGVSVTDSLLLTPMKSVTAVIGLSRVPQAAKVRGCAYCGFREQCGLRKGGESCAI